MVYALNAPSDCIRKYSTKGISPIQAKKERENHLIRVARPRPYILNPLAFSLTLVFPAL